MDKPIPLNQENLSQIAEVVSCPTYDRSKVNAGIVHVGIGGFHRAHQAYYTNELLEKGGHHNWGICGIALLPFDDKIYQVLKNQDGLYTVMIKELDGSLSIKVIGSIVEYLFAPNNPLIVIEKMADPNTRIISLTITEGGYNYDEATGEFIFENPNIQHDLTHPDAPKTIFGYLAQAFKLRKERGTQGCTIQSCDNIQGNGHVTKKMVLSYIKKAEPDLVAWVNSNIAFPNSMVDRITPVTTKDDIELLKDKTGIQDDWPVVCEPFLQWVIEDDFSSGRPAWEEVGAQFVSDVAPYERMKLSLLNAGHSVLGILGALVGYNTIDEVVNDLDIKTFLITFMDKEVTPSLGELKGIDLKSYKASLIERFGNQNIKDQVTRICSESSAKIPKFLLPTVKYQLSNEGEFSYSALVIAAWAIYNKGLNENGDLLEISDAMKDELKQKALMSINNPKLFLELESVFGVLKESSQFVEAYERAYNKIVKYGIKKCVKDINSSLKK
ncbi:mannitol dehydrogenase family protein [Flavivirga aquimarina]|uniref:Mannitol dehydrogenase family protein n=1 Tax=Flavivirga aquimarina TaxID=2027862 RepID=A0ABT8W6N2_9FLAO|nr:mannitol dehydrogenase family protein [Flavivirga aquimarina]MDO5968771.1 mannitol dehydrogenase family protein [Flavivirga aquimarina]